MTIDTNGINANSSTPLPITGGGTGVNAAPTTPVASNFAAWDANKNINANNVIDGYATTVTSASPIVLTASSAYQQYLTGSTAQTITMPVTSTLASVSGGLTQSWLIVNNSSATATVNSSGGNLIVSLPAGSQSVVTCILNTGTTAASWASDFVLNTAGVSSITGTANQVIASASTGGVTLSTPQNIGTTSAVQFNSVQFNTTNALLDSNGSVWGTVSPNAPAVNYLQFTNGTTGNGPGIYARGSDSNVILQFTGQGTGGVQIQANTQGGNAATGYVGQLVSTVVASGSAVSIATITNVNMAQLTNLPAGDWDIFGNIFFNFTGTTSYAIAWISTTSATQPDNSLYASQSSATMSANGAGIVTPLYRLTISAATTVYITGRCSFSTGSCSMSGGIYARLRR